MNLLTIDQADLIGRLRGMANPNYRKEFEIMLEQYLAVRAEELARDMYIVAGLEARAEGEAYANHHDPHADAMADVPW